MLTGYINDGKMSLALSTLAAGNELVWIVSCRPVLVPRSWSYHQPVVPERDPPFDWVTLPSSRAARQLVPWSGFCSMLSTLRFTLCSKLVSCFHKSHLSALTCTSFIIIICSELCYTDVHFLIKYDHGLIVNFHGCALSCSVVFLSIYLHTVHSS